MEVKEMWHSSPFGCNDPLFECPPHDSIMARISGSSWLVVYWYFTIGWKSKKCEIPHHLVAMINYLSAHPMTQLRTLWLEVGPTWIATKSQMISSCLFYDLGKPIFKEFEMYIHCTEMWTKVWIQFAESHPWPITSTHT